MTISELIEKSGKPMTELSKELGIPYRTLQNWKLGNRKPPDYIVKMLQEKIESTSN